jgi:hypothetical protein
VSFKLGDVIGDKLRGLALPELRCRSGKRAFETKLDALRATRDQSGQHTPMAAYRCDWCQKIHLGHRRGRVL